jgi:hypothetical protein
MGKAIPLPTGRDAATRARSEQSRVSSSSKPPEDKVARARNVPWKAARRALNQDIATKKLIETDYRLIDLLCGFGLHKNGSCWRSKSTIAQDLALDPKTIQRSIKRLKEHRWLFHVELEGPDKDFPGNETGWRFWMGKRWDEAYEAYLEEESRKSPPGDTGVSPPGDTGVSPPGDTGVSQEEENKEEQNRKGECAPTRAHAWGPEPFCSEDDPSPGTIPLITPSTLEVVGPSMDELAKQALELFGDDNFAMSVSRERQRLSRLLQGRHDCYAEALVKAASRPLQGRSSRGLYAYVLSIAQSLVESGWQPGTAPPPRPAGARPLDPPVFKQPPVYLRAEVRPPLSPEEKAANDAIFEQRNGPNRHRRRQAR